jgi:tRNA (mo5U34)-methyltransferase
MDRLASEDRGELQARLDAHPFWYHTIDVAPGVSTPGWFDLRPVLDTLPWPDVRGKRCLDIGTFDGFFAFELERRGAAEVVAVDIEDHELWDWPPDAKPGRAGTGRQVGFTGPPKGAGFRLLAEIKQSKVDWRPISIYDLDPDELGTFDVIVCGTLLLHLQDPVRALEAVRRVCRGVLLSSEQIQFWLTILGRGRPLFQLSGPRVGVTRSEFCQWWLANAAGHRQLVWSAGFEIEQVSKPYVVRFNVHPKPRRTPRTLPTDLARWAVTGTWDRGIFHRALLARPRI